MLKKIKIISIVILSIVCTSCGFKKINSGEKLVNIQNLNITGEKRVSYFLKNNIYLISNENAENKYDIDIKLTSIKTGKIKDTTGKITRYNINISANFLMKNERTKKTITRIFNRKNDYNIAKSYSDTINNEKNATKNIIEQLSDDIITFITLSINN